MGIGSRVKVYSASRMGDASALLGCREVALPHGEGTWTKKGGAANQPLTVKP